MIDSVYVWGSDGRMNLFFRPMGTVFGIEGREEDCVADEDNYIIQWDGSPGFDSGYHEESFLTMQEARDAWEFQVKLGEPKHVMLVMTNFSST